MDHKSKKVYYIFGVMLLMFVGGYIYFENLFGDMMNDTEGEHVGEGVILSSFDVEKPYLILRGENLGYVEIWAIPSGTDITEDDYVFWGEAEQEGVHMWRMEIPLEPLSVTEVFAKGYTKEGELAGVLPLPHMGATNLYAVLWGSGEDLSDERTLKIDEEQLIEDLSITLLRIVEDSRCPKDVTCIWAGRVQAEIFFQNPKEEATALIATDSNALHFGGFEITIKEVTPEPLGGSMISENDYRVTVKLQK